MTPANAARYGIDTCRVFIGGHSMGGLAAARYAAAHPDVQGLILIDAWNAGAFGKDLRTHTARCSQADVDMADDLGNSVVGTNGSQLVITVRDGKMTHIREYIDTLEMARASGKAADHAVEGAMQ